MTKEKDDWYKLKELERIIDKLERRIEIIEKMIKKKILEGLLI